MENIRIEEFPQKTYFETDGKILIPAALPSQTFRDPDAEVLWLIQHDLGRMGISLRSEKAEFADDDGRKAVSASQVRYSVWFALSGSYQLKLYRLPTLNERGMQRMEKGMDNQNGKTLFGNAVTGTEKWAKGVLEKDVYKRQAL